MFPSRRLARPSLPTLTGLAVLATGLAACAITSTQVALPAALEGAERLPIRGTNGPMAGRVSVGDFDGTFRRSLRETTTLEVYERDGGGVRLTLTGPGLDAPVETDCTIKRRAVTVAGVSSPTLPTTYDCTLSGARAGAGAMTLDERTEVAGPYPFPVRRGRVTLGETTLTIRSLHAYAGIERESLSPIGYSFAAEDDGDRVLGAVSLLMPPTLTLAPSATPDERAAMANAGAVLALAWEPD